MNNYHSITMDGNVKSDAGSIFQKVGNGLSFNFREGTCSGIFKHALVQGALLCKLYKGAVLSLFPKTAFVGSVFFLSFFHFLVNVH